MNNEIHIILVDDSTTNNLLCKMMFEDEGYKLSVIEEGAIAFKMIKDTQPDMILLDLMMPGTDGLTVLRELKGDDETKNLPIVIVSAADSTAYIREAKKLNPLDYVKKPIGLNQLLEKVKGHLRSLGKI